MNQTGLPGATFIILKGLYWLMALAFLGFAAYGYFNPEIKKTATPSAGDIAALKSMLGGHEALVETVLNMPVHLSMLIVAAPYAICAFVMGRYRRKQMVKLAHRRADNDANIIAEGIRRAQQ